jgi:glycogen debranching enzyme
LRTLEPGSPDYSPRYSGSPQQRDSVYHQGTVWPWLLGHYANAHVNANSDSTAAHDGAQELVIGLEPQLYESGLGHISEIYDGNAPHLPRGCFAQAWSVSEVLRAATTVAATTATTVT